MNKKDNYEYFQAIGPNGLITLDKSESIFEKTVKRVTKKVVLDTRSIFRFKGSILLYNKCVISNFEKTTIAKSRKQAYNNIVFHAKKELNLIPSAGGVTLSGTLEEIERV